MNSRVASFLATAAIQAAFAYVLIATLAMTISREPDRHITSVDVSAKSPLPPSPPLPSPILRDPPAGRPREAATAGQAVVLGDWSAASPEQREADFIKAARWRQDNLPESDRRLAAWRATAPQGSGPGKVTRSRPEGLASHTIYWPAGWTKGPLPIVAWGNGMCRNSSLPYAAFLAEIASHGYLVVAVGNDDIDYPQPDGIQILADGRAVRTQASALGKGIDWAVAENRRPGSPLAGKLDAGKIAYVGHGCGGEQALQASTDPRTTTTVILNGRANLSPDASAARKTPLLLLQGAQEDRDALDAAEVSLASAREAGWTFYKAALGGLGRDDAYAAPDRRWSRAVLAWLDWQLKGDGRAAAMFAGGSHPGWSRIGTTLGAPRTSLEAGRTEASAP